MIKKNCFHIKALMKFVDTDMGFKIYVAKGSSLSAEIPYKKLYLSLAFKIYNTLLKLRKTHKTQYLLRLL
jgi:hypothetical protein